MNPNSQDTLQRLLENLGPELFQTETSASRHCRREAKRYAGAAPSVPLLATAKHADGALVQLKELTARDDMKLSTTGVAIGALLSSVRERLADHLIEAERSYRGTLIGMRHGVDLVITLRHVVTAANRLDWVRFCDEWLNVRVPLVAQTEQQLAWFAEHSDRAIELARPLSIMGRARSAV